MVPSSYQMERLLDQFRRLSQWLAWPAYRRWRGEERVRLSRAARQAAAAGEGVEPADAAPGAQRPPPSVAAVRSAQRYAPRVEAERERRAGSFMAPPYVPDGPEVPIPRAGERAAPRRPARSVADGD